MFLFIFLKKSFCRDYAVHLINRTNLILLVVQGTCGKGNKERISIKPSEVHYELDEDIENMTVHNEVVAQICRVPILTLERKKPSTMCFDYDKRVSSGKNYEFLLFSLLWMKLFTFLCETNCDWFSLDYRRKAWGRNVADQPHFSHPLFLQCSVSSSISINSRYYYRSPCPSVKELISNNNTVIK